MDYCKRHWKKIIFIALLFVVFLGRFQTKMPKRNFADFHVNYYTGQRMLNHQNVYDLDGYRADGMANFKYPPLFATIAALFALTSERVAATVWFIIGFVLLIVFMNYSGRLIFTERISYRQKQWVYFWSLFLTSRFYMQNFDQGQVNFLMMTTLLMGIYALSKQKEATAGFLFGFSSLIKYMSAIFLPYFLFKKKFRLIAYAAIAMVFFSFLPALVWGWGHNLYLQKQFFPYLCKTSLDIYSLSDYANQSLFSAIVRLFSPYGEYKTALFHLNDTALFCIMVIAAAALYLSALVPSKRKSCFRWYKHFDIVDIGLVFICAALFNPNAWSHAYIFLTFGYMAALSYLFSIKIKDKAVIALLAFSFFLHSFSSSFFTELWAGELFEAFSFVTWGALALFLCLLKIKFFPAPIKQ